MNTNKLKAISGVGLGLGLGAIAGGAALMISDKLGFLAKGRLAGSAVLSFSGGSGLVASKVIDQREEKAKLEEQKKKIQELQLKYFVGFTEDGYAEFDNKEGVKAFINPRAGEGFLSNSFIAVSPVEHEIRGLRYQQANKYLFKGCDLLDPKLNIFQRFKFCAGDLKKLHEANLLKTI